MSGRSPNYAEVAVAAGPRRVGARLSSHRRGHGPTRGACDECAAARYWMTSVARSSNGCGMARPRVLAVARLIARSNLLGSSMASSPGGGVPLRIRSTNRPALRLMSTRLGTVAHQQPGLGELAEGANTGQAVLQREIGDAPALREQQAAGCDEKRVRLLLHRGERGRQFGCVLDSHRIEHVYAEYAPRIRQRGGPASAKHFEVEVPEHREATDPGAASCNSSICFLNRSGSA